MNDNWYAVYERQRDEARRSDFRRDFLRWFTVGVIGTAVGAALIIASFAVAVRWDAAPL